MSKNVLLIKIIDTSSSMSSMIEEAKSSLKADLKVALKEQEGDSVSYQLRLVSFNSDVRFISDGPLDEKCLADIDLIQTSGMTALRDAVGKSIEEIDAGFDGVYVDIFTDGNENASQKFTPLAIQEMVKYRTTQGWEFKYFGANQDAVLAGSEIGINVNNCINYNVHNYNETMQSSTVMRGMYVQSLHSRDNSN